MNRPIVLKPACIKTLSAVEALPNSSNQHEFNGVAQLKDIFGDNRLSRSAEFSIRGLPISETVNVTWYDAREAHASRTEYRLYFQTNKVMKLANEGDNILIGFEKNKLHIILILKTSTGFQSGPSTWGTV